MHFIADNYDRVGYSHISRSPIGGQGRKVPTKGTSAKIVSPEKARESLGDPFHKPEYQLSLAVLYSTTARVGPVHVSELVGLATHARSLL